MNTQSGRRVRVPLRTSARITCPWTPYKAVRIVERDMETGDKLKFQLGGLWTQKSLKSLENEELVPFWSRQR